MQSSSSKTKQFSFLLLITLGVMTAFGPLTIDMYVPSLPKCKVILVRQHQKFN